MTARAVPGIIPDSFPSRDSPKDVRWARLHPQHAARRPPCSRTGTYSDASSAFGAQSLTVSQMLAVAASQSNVGGSVWYANVKAVQQLAKNAFDAINNRAAQIAP